MNKINLNLDSNLLTTLKDSFSNKRTVYSELMQNALRAKASKVQFNAKVEIIKGVEIVTSLVVSDNGIGISDFQNLLTIGKTGWDFDTQKVTAPYGVGFLSSLSACEEIHVSSNGKGFKAKTNSVLNSDPISIGKIDNLYPGVKRTEIGLLGVSIELCNLIEDIRALSEGFPIEVFLNDKEVERPYSADKLIKKGAETVDGSTFFIRGLHSEKDMSCSNTKLFLQGIPVGIQTGSNTSSCHIGKFGINHFNHNIIHLNPISIKARMPDREVLLDSVTVSNMIDETFVNLWMKFFANERKTLGDKEFVIKHWDTVFTRNSTTSMFGHIFNNIEYIPMGIFSKQNEYPIFDSAGCFNLKSIQDKSVISKQEFINKEYKLFEIDNDSSSNYQAEDNNCFIALMFAYCCKDKVLIIDNSIQNIPKEHWIFMENFESIETEEVVNQFSYALNGDIKEEYFGQGDWTSFNATFCDSYTITHIKSGESVTIYDDAFVSHDQNGVVIPSKCKDGYVAFQLGDFTDEYDHYFETQAYAEKDSVARFIKIHQGAKPEDILQELLSELALRSYGDFLMDKTFTIETKTGQLPTVVLSS